MLVVEISNNILGEHICLVITSLNKNNLDETILNKFSDKMVANFNVLGPGSCAP